MTIEPPEAKKIPSPRTFHGDTVVDEYAWLADKADPDTIGYLRAENAYTDALTAHLAPLREQIFEEIKARTQESDLSVPVRKGGWWHYSRTVEGKQYAVFCRRAVRPGEVIPPSTGEPSGALPVLPADAITVIPASTAFCTARQSGSVVDGSVTRWPSERLMILIL